MWLTALKTALALEEIDTVSLLIERMPVFETLEEMETAAYLLQNAKNLIEDKKVQTTKTMQQLKSTLDFLKSTQTDLPSSLNLKF